MLLGVTVGLFRRDCDRDCWDPRKTTMMEAASLDDVGPLERSTSLSSRALTLIRHAIVSGLLQPGETISPQEIGKRLGVSRTPVREALIQLNAIGLVEFLPGRVQIASASPAAIRDAFELREALEGKAAALAAQRRTAAEAETIMTFAIQSGWAAEKSDRLRFHEQDRSFHLAVAAASHSVQLARYLENVLDLALTLRNLRTAKSPFHAKSVGYHKAIAQAIADRDAVAAEKLSRSHVAEVADSILD
jgi:DNA-binding GntR family transcriptional regulator